MILQPAPGDELRALLNKTDKEKPSLADKKALDAYIAEHGIAEMAKVGNLAYLVADSTIRHAFGHDYGFSEAVRVKTIELRDGLGYKQAPPLEKMLIQHIVMAWLRLYICEFYYGIITSGECTLARAEFWEKSLSMAQRRYLRVIETLARVRKMNLVALQVNIAGQQIITGGK
jgi:hypothetical protein